MRLIAKLETSLDFYSDSHQSMSLVSAPQKSNIVINESE